MKWDEYLKEIEERAEKLEPHHEYIDAEPSRSGKTGWKCSLCNHYTNGAERGKYSPCPSHISRTDVPRLIKRIRELEEAVHKLRECRASACLECSDLIDEVLAKEVEG